MKFAFMGCLIYDLGYLVGNLISQYCAACFKRFPSEQNRKQFKAYLLATIKSLIETYMKDIYFMLGKECEGRDTAAGAVTGHSTGVMVDMPGYASMVNWFHSVSDIPYPDFDVIENKDAKAECNGTVTHDRQRIMFGKI